MYVVLSNFGELNSRTLIDSDRFGKGMSILEQQDTFVALAAGVISLKAIGIAYGTCEFSGH